MAARGRPTRYTTQLANAICWQLTQGESLLKICQREGMPHRTTVHHWLDARPDFFDMYARAREIQAHVLADEVLAIADDSSRDRTEDGSPDWGAVQRARLRVDTRKWMAGKLMPHVYGDKPVQAGNDRAGPVQVEAHFNFSRLTLAELGMLRALMAKAAGDDTAVIDGTLVHGQTKAVSRG
jgi:hypothetical protein